MNLLKENHGENLSDLKLLCFQYCQQVMQTIALLITKNGHKNALTFVGTTIKGSKNLVDALGVCVATQSHSEYLLTHTIFSSWNPKKS